MCKLKCLGGMGFWDLVSFNKTLVAKQGWSLLRAPNSLLALALKGRYFEHKESFLGAELGSNPSFI